MARALLAFIADAADDNDAATFALPQELTTSTLGDDDAIIDGEVVDDAVVGDAQNQGLRRPTRPNRTIQNVAQKVTQRLSAARKGARGRRSARRSVAALNLPSPWTQTGHTWCHVPLTHASISQYAHVRCGDDRVERQGTAPAPTQQRQWPLPMPLVV